MFPMVFKNIVLFIRKNMKQKNSFKKECDAVSKDVDNYMGINVSEFKGRYIDSVNGSLSKLFFDLQDMPASDKKRCGELLKEVRDKVSAKLKLLKS